MSKVALLDAKCSPSGKSVGKQKGNFRCLGDVKRRNIISWGSQMSNQVLQDDFLFATCGFFATIL